MSGWSEPEQQHGVPSINHWNTQQWQLDEEQAVAENKVTAKHHGFDNLTQELSGRLGHGHPAQTGGVPLTRPPRSVGLIVLEFSSQAQANNQLQDQSLNGNGGNHTKKGLLEHKALQEPHDFKEDDLDNDRDTVGNTRHHGRCLLATNTQQWTSAARDGKQDHERTCVDDNRSKRHNSQSQDRVDWLGISHTVLSVHEGVGNKGRCGNKQWNDEFSENQVTESCSSNVTSALFTWIAQNLSLETSDSGSGQSDITNPRVSVNFVLPRDNHLIKSR